MTTIRFFVALALVLYYFIIISLIRNNKIILKYALIWIIFGIFLMALDLFPYILYIIAEIMGIEVPSNALFLIMIFLLVLISIVMTGIVSSQVEKNRQLIQQIALLTNRIQKLEDAVKIDKPQQDFLE